MSEEQEFAAPADHPEISLASIATVGYLLKIVSFVNSPELTQDDARVFQTFAWRPLTAEQALDCRERIWRYRNLGLEDFTPERIALALGEPGPYWDDYHTGAPKEARIKEIGGVPVFYSVSDWLRHLNSQRLPVLLGRQTQWMSLHTRRKASAGPFSGDN
jgi:hypothetical protein